MHVTDQKLTGRENAAVKLVHGQMHQVDDWKADAIANSRKYALRHFVLNPEKDLTREQLHQAVTEIATEYGFGSQDCILIQHTKDKIDSDAIHHFHLLVREVSPYDGSVMKSSWSHAINERLSRICEHLFGHRFVNGKWTKSVVKELENERPEIAAAIITAGLLDEETPVAAYSDAQKMKAKKAGHDLPTLRAEIAAIVDVSCDGEDIIFGMRQAGMRVKRGDKEGIFIAIVDGCEIGAVHRLAKVQKRVIFDHLDPVIDTQFEYDASHAPESALECVEGPDEPAYTPL